MEFNIKNRSVLKLCIVFLFACFTSCNKETDDNALSVDETKIPENQLQYLLDNTFDKVYSEADLLEIISNYEDSLKVEDFDTLSMIKRYGNPTVQACTTYGYSELLNLPGQSGITMKFMTTYPEVARAFGIRTNEVAIIEYYRVVKHITVPMNIAISASESPYCGKQPEKPATVWDRGYAILSSSNFIQRNYSLTTYVVHPICNTSGQAYAEHWFPCRLNDVEYRYLRIAYY